MKWLLAASELAVLVALWRCNLLRDLPVLASYSALLVFSSITYFPQNAGWFVAMEIAFLPFRCWILYDCLERLLAPRLRPLLSLILAASCLGGVVAVLLVAWIEPDFTPAIGAMVYIKTALTGAFWAMLCALWFSGMPKSWERSYAVTIGWFFAVTAFARISSAHWSLANNAAMLLETCCFLRLLELLFRHHDSERYHAGCER